MSKRVSVVLPDDLGTVLEEMAATERRSHSQMGAILIEEAIASRQGKQFPTLVSPEPLPAPTFEPEPLPRSKPETQEQHPPAPELHLEPPTPPSLVQPEAVQSETQPPKTPEVSKTRQPRHRFKTDEG
jgi:hypothetical protein